MKRSLLVGGLSAVLAAGGCGSVDVRERAAADTAVRMLRAVADSDGAAACALLAPDTVADLEEAKEKPCATAILDEDLPAPGAVTGRAVYGQRAQVRVAGDTEFLAVFPGGWRVVAAGCTPDGAAPYDCTVQGG